MSPTAPAQPPAPATEAPPTQDAKLVAPEARAKQKPRRPPTLDVGRCSSASPRPAVVEGGVVKLGRRDAWARFLAYDVRALVWLNERSADHLCADQMLAVSW